MTDKQSLDNFYKQNLENEIIKYIAKRNSLDLRKAFDIYYSSRLSRQIEAGMYGIENLDYKYLAEDLMENEPELFPEK